MILAIRTDQPEAEIYLYQESNLVDSYSWLAHRELARDLLKKCDQLLHDNSISWQDLTGLVVFKGPGSFTGLRIGIVTIMSVAYALNVPAVGTAGEDWLEIGIQRLLAGDSDELITPEYGAEPRITQARK